jgi:predicted RNase H-like HicB family nuclease
MQQYYTAFIHKEKGSCFGITFPDFPGCVAASDTKEKALREAREALQLCIDVMFESKEHIPEPGDIDPEWISAEADDIEGSALIPVEVPHKSVRLNISMADHIVERIDTYAKRQGDGRSGFLTRAALEYIERHALR